MSASLKKPVEGSFQEHQGKHMDKISPPKRRYSALKKQMEDSLSM